MRRRGLVVVISDFLGDSDWNRPLRGLSARHELLAIEVVEATGWVLVAIMGVWWWRREKAVEKQAG